MSCRCGCCRGTTTSVPEVTARRPGLPALTHRVGVHATFLESMLAELGAWPVNRRDDEIESWLFAPGDLPQPDRLTRVLSESGDPAISFVWSTFAEADQQAMLNGDDVQTLLVEGLNSIVRGASIYTTERFAGRHLDRQVEELLAGDLTPQSAQQLNRLLLEAVLGRHVRAVRAVRPLDGLTTCDPADFSIALLDAWATVADVVTFYQERFVDEGYLRTATERRSVLELARLIGYEPRPGVAAGAFLAFTLQEGHEVEIPTGTLSKSTPAPGELPQPFETSEPLDAKATWNQLVVRRNRPQLITNANALSLDRVLLAGTRTNLRVNDVLLFAFGNGDGQQYLRTVHAIEQDEEADRTIAVLHTAGAATVDEAAVMAVIARHSDLPAFPVAQGATTDDVMNLLGGVQDRIQAGAVSDLPDVLRATIRELRSLHAAAVEAGHSRLAPWLDSLAKGLLLAAGGGSAPEVSAAMATPASNGDGDGDGPGESTVTPLDAIAAGLGTSLLRPPTGQPANRLRLNVNLAASFATTGDLRPRLLTALQPAYRRQLYAALAGSAVSSPSPVEVYTFRVRSSLYGHNVSERPYDIAEDGTVTRAGDPLPHEVPNVVDLAQPYDAILPGSWVVVRPFEVPSPTDDDNGDLILLAAGDDADSGPIFARAGAVAASVSRADYGITSKVTRIELGDPADPQTPVEWFSEPSFGLVRGTEVLAQAEQLTLANEPIPTDVAGDEIELDALHEGLEPGRWAIVSGERVLEGVAGVKAAELVMIAGVEHRADATRPGERLHTFLQLAGTAASGEPGLAYRYKRDPCADLRQRG